jgi:FMN phosphatase YigB (HAD superfamily)
MAKSLQDYAEWLDERKLMWPAAPAVVPAKATPYLKPLPDVRGVVWNVYGTLLRISDGRLLVQHPEPMRMQIALEKTIEEFNMWNSMSRKPGAPWEYMLQQYTRIVEDRQLAGSGRKGETPEVNTAEIWKALVERLGKKEYSYDEDQYGDLDDFSEKVAYFFQSCLQGVAANDGAIKTLQEVMNAGYTQGLVADAQPFTLVQLLRALGQQQGRMPFLGDLFDPNCLILSVREGYRQPSVALFEKCVSQFDRLGMAPNEILYIGSRLKDELAPAKKLGLRTALFAGDKNSLQATSADLKLPELRPDRILTELSQVRQILGIG